MTAVAGDWGRFELPVRDATRLGGRMAAWTGASAAGALVAGGVGLSVAPVVALATAAGVVAARPTRTWLLPALALGVFGAIVALDRVGVPLALAAGMVAGGAVGGGPLLSRFESVLAGVGAAGVGHWALGHLAVPGLAGWVVLGAGLGLATAHALVPGALRFAARSRLPPGRFIATTLAEGYRPPCYRALALDEEVARRAPDRATRDGLREVGGWVYRLALTLQTLDGDVARIDPADVAARRAALEPEDPDPFVAERRRSTRAHLDRLLQHREALVRERARVASLQEYALAWLEEARAGLALAQQLPAEGSPEQLDVVLEKLRSHANEVGARRASARELGLG